MFDDIPVEIQDLLNEHIDITIDVFPNELPLVRRISHHIGLVGGASFPNKATYRMTPKESEEIRKHVQDLLDKELVRESPSPCVVPIVLSPKKDGGWRLCTDSKEINKITIRYKYSLSRMDYFGIAILSKILFPTQTIHQIIYSR